MNRLAFLFFLLIGVLTQQQGMAQKQTTHVQQTWFNYANQTRFSDRWGMWLDGSARTREDWLSAWSQVLGRVGATYYINNNVKLTAAYAYVHSYPAAPHTGVARPEHRPWQQIQWHNNKPNLRVMQWVRLEERFRRKIAAPDRLGEGHDFNYRVRQNILLLFPLSKKPFEAGTLSAIANNEVFLNFGKEVVLNTFDQNRLFFGLAYHVNAQDQIHAGYMNLYQQQNSGNQYRMVHTARISYFHNLDLREKK
jgi:hypothetical protein